MVDRSLFDYPTFNALYKMNPDYQWFYASALKASVWAFGRVYLSSYFLEYLFGL